MLVRVSATTSFKCRGFFSEGFASHLALTNERPNHSFTRHLHHFGSASKGTSHGSFSIPHPIKNWQELRKKKLTASTFGGAIGFWPRRRIQLWLEKIGAREPFAGNMATSWNNIKEEEALERYKLITGNKVLFPKLQVYANQNAEDDWLGCSPDGVVDHVVYDMPSHGVLEIKCPFFNGDNRRMYPWSRIPLHCIPQAQGLMEILDKDWMDLYCWTVNGSSLFRLYRDRKYWELMKRALTDFWWDHVIPARELYKKSPVINPLVEMRSLMPAPRHELLPVIVLASKYVVDDSELKMREIQGKLQVEASWSFPQLKCDQLQIEEFKFGETR
ncbi:Restriction endonuclease, type II-like superfamily protein [Thalictrum thalictroides]|uniref:Restriction endonuclease, type II-like superfamily protein n=1 Tax=Thalictrum thalictroides TaxID=46969 RepID=A0A7J6WUG2_THATH|nr:Restriction endonuclease, type II-like superfamily protein [Thalictrum thalictroides]